MSTASGFSIVIIHITYFQREVKTYIRYTVYMNNNNYTYCL